MEEINLFKKRPDLVRKILEEEKENKAYRKIINESSRNKR